MKRLLTCLEEKRMLVFLLVSLAALTILAAVTVYQIRTAGDSGYESAQQTQESGDGIEVAAANQDPDPAAELTPEENDVPNAEDVGIQTLVSEETPAQTENPAAADPVPVQAGAAAMNLNYDGSARLIWPVDSRNIVMDYSMDSTVYYATLNQYKVSRGILIQEEPGNAVFAPADSLVTEVGTNEEIGNYVVLKLGDTYSATLGNLSNVTVTPNQYILQGTVLGVLAEPTKYYVVEGPNLYFEMRNAETPVDPLAYLE